MASKTKTGTWRLSYSLGKNSQREISLCSDFGKQQVNECETLLKLLVKNQRYGTPVSVRDWQKIDSLPDDFRDKLVTAGLIEPSQEQKNITIDGLIKEYEKKRVGLNANTLLHDKRIYSYLREYFGSNKRINEITQPCAEGIRDYLMNQRKKGRGQLLRTSTNKAIISIKPIFRFACECGYLTSSPFSNVKGGKTANPERQYYVDDSELDAAIRACDDVELAGILAFARYAGLRIPSEITDLKFSDFEFTEFGTAGLFNVPDTGKTGKRRVPFFEELQPYFLDLYSNRKPNQEYLFNRYRNNTNIGTTIRKKMRKQGLTVWEKFFVNLRSSCITEKERLGWKDSVLDAIFGNTKAVRIGHYIQPLPDAEFALYGKLNNKKETVSNTPEQGFDEMEYGINMAVIGNLFESLSEKFPMQNPISSGNPVRNPMSVLAISEFYGDREITEKDIFRLSEIEEEYQEECLKFISGNEFCRKILKYINYLYNKYCKAYYYDYSKKMTVDLYVNMIKKQVRYFAEWVKNSNNFFAETCDCKEVKIGAGRN